MKAKSKRRIDNNTIEYTYEYKNGLECIFRHHTDTDTVEAKFDDNFAKCNGYKDKSDMIHDTNLKRDMGKFNFGIMPEWIQISDKGEYYIKLKNN